MKGAENAKGGVYALKDANGVVKRTGRTGDLAGREAQHKVGKETSDLTFDAVHRTDNYAELFPRSVEPLPPLG